MYAVIYWEKLTKTLFSPPKIFTDESGYICQYKTIEMADKVAEDLERHHNREARTISLEPAIE